MRNLSKKCPQVKVKNGVLTQCTAKDTAIVSKYPKIKTNKKMSPHIITIHNIIMCVNVSNLDVFTSKN